MGEGQEVVVYVELIRHGFVEMILCVTLRHFDGGVGQGGFLHLIRRECESESLI